MAREITSDFLTLQDFIQAYSLSNNLLNSDYKTFISQQHKKYFSYLTLIAELSNYTRKRKYTNQLSIKQFEFIKESCSDIGTAFFYSFHGGYKGSKLLLRSSIETFLKGFCLDELKNLDKETSIYVLFRKVRRLSLFCTSPGKEIIDEIHQQYKVLCEDVHTASILNMANLSALNYFPSFDKKEGQILSKSLLSIVPCYISLLTLKYNEQYHAFHYNNKKIIISSISTPLRSIINKVE